MSGNLSVKISGCGFLEVSVLYGASRCGRQFDNKPDIFQLTILVTEESHRYRLKQVLKTRLTSCVFE